MGTTGPEDGPSWQPGGYIALALIALVFAIVAIVVGFQADVVEIQPVIDLSSTPALDQYTPASVEELRRSNDRVLTAIWAILGITVALLAIVVGFNAYRGDRIIERERVLVAQEFEQRLTASETAIRSQVSTLESSMGEIERQFRESVQPLMGQIAEDRRERAALEYRLLILNNTVFRLRSDVYQLQNNGQPIPYVEVRVNGWRAHAHEFLSAAIRSERPELINEVLVQLDHFVTEPNPQTSLYYEALQRDLGSLPVQYDPLRSELLRRMGTPRGWEIFHEEQSSDSGQVESEAPRG